MKKLILILATILLAACQSTGYHYNSKERAYISKTDTVRGYYLPNRVY